MKTSEGNRIIAEFMGYIPRTDLHTNGALMMQTPRVGNATHSPCYIVNKENDVHDEFLELKYDSDWNWLMRSWDKVRGMVKPVQKGNLIHNCENLLTIMKMSMYNGDISKSFETLVQIILWYNKHNQK